MDEVNYRRLTALPKQRCEDCGATAYEDPSGTFRCVVCDHEQFELCLNCGQLLGWCTCPPPPPPKRARRARTTRARK